MLRITHALLIAGVGFSAQPAPPVEAGVSKEDSVDRAFAHALDRARDMADKLDISVEHPSWEDPWVIQSKHYELRTNASRAFGMRMVTTLEDMLPIYQDLFDTEYLPRTRIPVLIHPSQEAYNQFGNDHSDERSSIWGGFFDPGNPGGAIATVHSSNEALERMYLVYASCQEFVTSAFDGRPLPTPLDQGLGAYAQTFWAWEFLLTRYEELRDNGQLPPLGQLLNAGRSAYVGQSDVYLVQLAVTFTYLRTFREDTRSKMSGARLLEAGPFDEYVRKAVRRGAFRDDPVHKLLTDDVAELDAEIRAFRGWRGN